MKIAFIVGKGSDNYPYKYTSKKAPVWLKQGIKEYLDFVNEDNTVPSDVAMAAYLNYHHPKDTIGLMQGYEESNISKKKFDEWDTIFVIYDAIEIFHCAFRKTCPSLRLKFERTIRTTTAVVYPFPDFHRYIINKGRYYSDLRRAGVPVAPFFTVRPSTASKSPKAFKDRIIAKGWKGVIIKPSYAGYSLGIKVIKNIKATKLSTLRNHFKKLEEKGFPNAVIQEFVASFGDNFEIRTYWIDQKYAYSVATLTAAVGTGEGLPIHGFDTFVKEGGNIPNSVLAKLRLVAAKVFSSILQYPVKHPMVRIDFGCCLNVDGCAESYFVNEVETMAANLLADHTEYPAVENIAKAAYRFSSRLNRNKRLRARAKKGIKVKKVSRLAKNKTPCRRK